MLKQLLQTSTRLTKSLQPGQGLNKSLLPGLSKAGLSPSRATLSSHVTAPPSEHVSPPCLSLNKVSISYNGIPAIEQASLKVAAGKITALVGPSGCGKSSLLASINRMTDTVPHCQVSGEIRLDERNILDAATDLSTLRQQIGMVFQQPNPFPLSILDNIRFPLKEHGIHDPQKIHTIVEKVLKEVGLWDEVKDRLKSQALQLSGGQQQRLCIARCLALKPKVILFDEPCSALDPLSSATVENLIKQLTPEYTVLMVTHNLAQARRIADHVAVCWVQAGCGCIIESGDTESIFERSIHPITRAFCQGEQG